MSIGFLQLGCQCYWLTNLALSFTLPICREVLLFILNSTSQGKENPSTDQEAVKLFLGLVKHAKEIKIDRCRFNIFLFNLFDACKACSKDLKKWLPCQH